MKQLFNSLVQEEMCGLSNNVLCLDIKNHVILDLPEVKLL